MKFWVFWKIISLKIYVSPGRGHGLAGVYRFPFSQEHVTYVWFDALINYISAVGNFDAQNIYHSNWWDKDVKVVHLVGKDILRHHAIYWPIMLKALGVRQPDTIFAHGWWMINEDKMSKSRGKCSQPG